MNRLLQEARLMTLVQFVPDLLFRSHDIEERSLVGCERTASGVDRPWCYLLTEITSILLTSLSLLMEWVDLYNLRLGRAALEYQSVALGCRSVLSIVSLFCSSHCICMRSRHG